MAETKEVQQVSSLPTLEKKPFASLSTTREQADLFILTNSRGTSLHLTDYGATLVALKVLDKQGQLIDVTVGYSTLESYLKDHPYFGSTVGRFCNRIAQGKFSLDGKEYILAKNNGPNHLHGGLRGFDKMLWNAKPNPITKDSVSIEFSYRSVDGEEGYPGNVDVSVVYTLTNADEVKIEFRASTDKRTIINLTNHAYFNLSGRATDVLDHVLTINAEQFTPVNEVQIPLGTLQDVGGTPFDFRQPHTIGERIAQDDAQLRFGSGYDHNWALAKNSHSPHELTLAATAAEPSTGIKMECWTTQVGLQFYTGNFLDGSLQGKLGPIQKHHGFCLETQHFPDSPNQPNFPSTVLSPGETFYQQTIFKFYLSS